MSQSVVDSLIVQLKSLPVKDRKKVVASVASDLYLSSIVYKLKVRGARKKTSNQKLLWHNIRVDIKDTPYLIAPQDLWRLDSLIGSTNVSRVVRQHPQLDSELIEKLFSDAPFQLYGNADETFLLSTKNELMEADFGPLHAITPLDALKRFGLDMLETAKEKGYVRVRAQ